MISTRVLAGPAALAAVLALAGCKTGDFMTDPGSNPPVVTPLTCTQNGTAAPCTLPSDSTVTAFDIVLVSSSCDAVDDYLRVTQPVTRQLTADACHEQVNKTWTINGPFAAGTALNVEIVSTQLQRPPSLQATGQYPQWTLTFEDGGDSDFNDVVLTVTARP